jgi:hypothetical protein
MLPQSYPNYTTVRFRLGAATLCFNFFYMIEAKPENLVGDYDSDPLHEE